MSDFKKAVLAGLIIGGALGLIATHAHAANASANQGHHGGGNNGAMGASAGAFGGSATGSSAAGASAGQGGQGGSYGDWYLRVSPVDNYQPWPQSEMKQFQKP